MPTVFFSWQSDRKNGRNFLVSVLQAACKKLSSDAEVEEAHRGELSVDKDTQGMAGHQPIVDTIFKKIDSCGLFVADLTFIAQAPDGGKQCPNPNVMMEAGWALKRLGHGRIIYVMNEYYGEASETSVPFDIRHLSWPIRYSLGPDATPEEKKKVKETLQKQFESAIKRGLEEIPTASATPRPGFAAMTPLEGEARFRKSGEAIGNKWDTLGDHQEVHLASGPAVWLRLYPLHHPGKTWTLDQLKSCAFRTGQWNLKPIYSHGVLQLRGPDGLGFSGGDGPEQTGVVSSIAYVFRTGEIWSIDTEMLDANLKIIPVPLLLNQMTQAIDHYVTMFTELELPGPFKVIAGIEGVNKWRLHIGSFGGIIGQRSVILSDQVITEAEYVVGMADATSLCLDPFFTQLFDHSGLAWKDFRQR